MFPVCIAYENKTDRSFKAITVDNPINANHDEENSNDDRYIVSIN